MYSLEAAKFIMERYQSHKIIFIGDPGAQLPLVQPRNAPPLTAYNAEKLGIPVIKFDTNFRCKCPKLQVILDVIREMTMRVDHRGNKVCKTEEIMDRMKELLRDAGHLIKPEDVPSKYDIEDMILVSRRNEEAPFVKEWTDRLAPLA